MDSRLDQNQSELRVLVLSVSLQVLSDRDSLLDQEVQVLWDLWSQTVRFQDSQDLVTGDNLSLGNTVGISQENTNLRRSQTLSGVLDDVLNNVTRGQLEPRWSVSRVWESGGRNTFSLNDVSKPVIVQRRGERHKVARNSGSTIFELQDRARHFSLNFTKFLEISQSVSKGWKISNLKTEYIPSWEFRAIVRESPLP